MTGLNVDVRQISQQEYDAVPIVQRSFYDSLISSGKMVITIPASVTAVRKGPFEALFNEYVVVYFNSGNAVKTAIRGRLTGVYTYEITLDDGSIVCFKSNILCVKKCVEPFANEGDVSINTSES